MRLPKAIVVGALVAYLSGAGSTVGLSDEMLAYGEYLSSECTTCHRLDGSDKGIPSIVGWPELDFVDAMMDYKEGLRQHEIMQNVSRSLGVEEMAALAKFFSQQNPTE